MGNLTAANPKIDSDVDAKIADAQFLIALGRHVRKIRVGRGLSRKSLAQSADVSERYLAQLESGEANVSILLLRQIANAMQIRLDNLLELDARDSADYDFIRNRLRQLSVSELAHLRTGLSNLGSGNDRKAKRIALIGLRGAGKSTIGYLLATRLQLRFVELTDVIEEVAGMKIDEIFSLGGQSSYRNFEQQAFAKIFDELPCGIIAVGGSVVADTNTFEKLLSEFTSIWLRASPEEHMSRVLAQGDNRPMAGNRHAMEELRRILTEREPLYQLADYVVDTHGKTAEQTIADVISLPVVSNLDSR